MKKDETQVNRVAGKLCPILDVFISLRVLIIFSITLFLLFPTLASAFAGGDGSAGNPYQITDWNHLNDVRNNLAANFVLNNNIDSTTPGYDTYASATANGGAGWEPKLLC